MNLKALVRNALLVALPVLALSACAGGPAGPHARHHAGEARSMQAHKGMDAAMACAMHEDMMRARSPEERRAMMAEHMKKMPPEKMKQHMEMMEMKLQMMREHMAATSK